MTNMTFKYSFNISFSLLMILFTQLAFSKPMDAEKARHIPELRRIATSLASQKTLSKQNADFLIRCMESNDPVLISTSTWIVGEIELPSPKLVIALLSLDPDKLSQMPRAFTEISIKKVIAKLRQKKWNENKDTEALEHKNIYAKIESTRENLTVDVERNKKLLQALQVSESPLAKAAAYYLAKRCGIEKLFEPYPMVDERYELVLSVILGE